MTQPSRHIHVIDGKTIEYDQATCPICHPEQQPQPTKTYPTCYRKKYTVVMQTSKGVMSTTTYWQKENCVLHSVKAMQVDASGKAMLDQDRKPIWNQQTIRLSVDVLHTFITELSKLHSDILNAQNIPQRA